jgi:4-amino-4-deoxy-L-arabinose transferase-like glycosyltransferase
LGGLAEDHRSTASPTRTLLLFVAAITCARLVLAATIPLTEDEAYYRLWASSLQFGYYDHPPMIAWWIRAGMTLAGDRPLGVRLLPALSSGLSSLLVFDLAQRLGASAKVGERAAIWFNATLLIGAGGLLATPDSASTPFWVLTVWALARSERGHAARWWLAAGAFAGLAAISKYSALFLGPGVLLWLALRPKGLRQLLTPWPWLAGLVAAAIFGVNVEWNATHHWASFAKQFGRVAPGRLAPQFLLELIAGQILLLNPPIAWFAGRGLWNWRKRVGGDLTLIVATSAPFTIYLVLHSLHDRVQAHWPAPLYPGLAICAALAAEAVPLAGVQAVLKRIAAPLGLGLSALAMLHLALPITDLRHVRDPSEEVRDWPAFARAVEAARIADHAGWIGTLSYGVAGQLSDQPAIKAPVAELVERDRYPPGEGSWRANPSQPGLVVDLDRRLNAKALSRCFTQVMPEAELVRGRAGYAPTSYAAFVVSGPKRDVLRLGCW